jgi:hypothetical protein
LHRRLAWLGWGAGGSIHWEGMQNGYMGFWLTSRWKMRMGMRMEMRMKMRDEE